MKLRRLSILVLSLMMLSATRAGADDPAKPAAPTKKAAAKDQAKEAPDEKTAPASVWMRKKLDYSQNILAGITSGDWELVAQNANAMKGLAKIESFVRARTPGYKTQMQVFQEANEEVLRQAARENPDGAALAFTSLTISCINCHKQLREIEKK